MNALSASTSISTVANPSALLANKAILAHVRISQWSARKVDKTVTDEINTSKNASADAGRYNKMLLDPKSLASITAAVSEARTFHLARTMPWADEGARLLPSMAFVDYKIQLETIKRKFDSAVENFISEYDRERDAAKIRLGDLFKDSDYPARGDISRKFGFELIFNPVPTAGDFRVDMAEAQAEIIRADIEARAAANLQEAMKDLYRRIGKVVESMADKLAAYKPAKGKEKAEGIFRDSLVANVADLAKVLPGLNIAADPHLSKIADRMAATLTAHSADDLRDNSKLRESVAAEAQAILEDISDFI